MRFYKYTPALLDPKTLEDTLIGRDLELDNIKRILKSASSGKSYSHPIVIGPKGIGKSHILRIIYHAVNGDIKTKGLNVFKDKFIPVIFSEEEYPGNLTKFIKLIINYLSESDSFVIPPVPAELMDAVTLNVKEREIALDYIRTFRKKSGNILLLLVDNLNDILERFTSEDQSALRDLLMTCDSLLLIGAAPTLFDSIINHDKPLYNFFEIIWLKDLPFDETILLLNRYAELGQRSDLLEKFKEEKAKLRAIHELAGGNPRLILSLYHIILEGDITSVEDTFLKLLDDLSPYFRERMKDLSEQQKEIIDVMARADGLLTPTEVAGRCHMSVNIVLSQIKRLEKVGYLKIAKKHAKKVFYDFNERLFSLWRQMRVEAGRKRLGFIVKFLEMWFTPKELMTFIDKTFDTIRKKLQLNYAEIQNDMDKLWYLKEAIPDFKGNDEICVACQRADYDVALEIIKKELKNKPNTADKLYKQGCIFRKQKLYDKAVQAYKKAVKINPNKDNVWNALADTYSILNRYDDAVDAYKKAIEIKSTDYESLNNLGSAYAELKRYDEAIDAFKKVIEIKPNNYASLNNLGSAYAELKRYDEAIDAFKKAIKNKPEDIVALNNLGNAYAQLKRYDDAIDTYKKAIEIKPNKQELLNNLGGAYAKLKRYDNAIDAFKKAIENKPEDHVALYNLGVIYSQLKRHDEAIDVYKKVLEIKPNSATLNNIGTTYMELKRYDEAIDAFKKVIEIKPDKRELLNNLGGYTYSKLNLIEALLSIFEDEGFKGNLDTSRRNIKEALIYFNNLEEQEEGINVFISAFKSILQAKKLDLLKIGIAEIERNKQLDLLEALSPFSTLINYLETKDPEIIDRLRHEERMIVEDMIRMVEGGLTKDIRKKKLKRAGTKKA